MRRSKRSRELAVVACWCASVLFAGSAWANNPPDAQDARFNLEEDGFLQDVLEATDIDNDPLQFRVVRAPKHGEANVDKTGKLTYRPKKNWHGTDELRWEVSDGKKKTVKKATFEVSEVNDAPTPGSALNLKGREDTPLRGRVTGSDLDGDRVSFAVGRRPRNGSVEIDERSGRFTYTPGKNFNGKEEFTLEVTDGRLSADVPVTVNLEPANDPPTTNDETARGREDGSARGRLRARDIDGDKITFSVATPPADGKVKLDPKTGAFTYTPNPNFNGTDEWEFFASDGREKAKGHVGVKITGVNDPPVTERVQAQTKEDIPLEGQVKAKDPDGDELFYSLSVKPRKGDVVVDRATGRFTYTPFTDYHGKDKFSVDVGDGNAALPTWVNVVVVSVNDAPEAVPAAVKTKEDTPATGKLQAQDVDEQKLTFKLSRPPRRGTATVSPDGSFKYVPKDNYFGEDGFRFEATDGAATARGDVLVAIAAVNDAPVAPEVSATTREDSPARGQVRASDIDRDKLTWELGKSPGKGKATVDERRGTFVYTPNKDENGDDAFSVFVSDGKARTEALVKVAIAPVNDTPVAQDGDNSGAEDTPITGLLVATDVDPDTLSYSVTSKPRRGNVVVDEASGSYTYTPDADYHGTDAFGFQASDGKARARGTVKLTITPVNDTPVAKPVSVKTAEDKAVRGSVLATDVDRNTLKWSLGSKSTRGTMTIDEKRGTFIYTPNKDANGDDTVDVIVSDGEAETRARISVVVAPVNDKPVAAAHENQGDEDTPITGKVAGRDVDPDTLSYAVASPPRSGRVEIDGASGAYTYKPKEHFHGADAFRFRVSDGKLSDVAEVKLTVASVNDAPEPKALVMRATEDRAATGRVEATDVDGDVLTYRVKKPPGIGEVSLDDRTGAVRYTSHADANGEDELVVEVSDGIVTRDASVKVTVAAAPDAPIINPEPIETAEDTPVVASLHGYDPDGDALTYRVVRGTSLGDAKVEPDGKSLRFVPKKDVHGEDALELEASDGRLRSRARIPVRVAARNDPPTVDPVAVKTREETKVWVPIIAHDQDGDPVKLAVKRRPKGADVKLRGNLLVVTPAKDRVGKLEIGVAARDDGGDGPEAVVTVEVLNENDPPEASNQSLTVGAGKSATVTVSASDVDEGDTLTFALAVPPKQGRARVLDASAGSISYTANEGAKGTDSFRVRVKDKAGATQTVTVAVKIR